MIGRAARARTLGGAAPVLALALVLACSGSAQNRPNGPSTDAVISFDCPVEDAEVWLAGRFLPDGLRRGIAVAPGAYRIEIRHDRYHTLYFEVTVAAGERRVITARPAEILP